MKKIGLLLLTIILLCNCQSTKTAAFDQFAYQKTVEIKIETNALMDKATTPYNQNLPAIGELLQKLKFIKEYEKNRQDNPISYLMWEHMTDKDKNFIVGFLQQWQDTQTLSPAFIPEAKEQINEAFELLMKYEQLKSKGTEQELRNLINAQ